MHTDEPLQVVNTYTVMRRMTKANKPKVDRNCTREEVVQLLIETLDAKTPYFFYAESEQNLGKGSDRPRNR